MSRSEFVDITINEIINRILQERGINPDRLGRVSFDDRLEGASLTIGRRGVIHIEIMPEKEMQG